MTATSSTRPAPGRPRDAATDQAILTAALEILIEHGYSRFTIEGVAARAGVGKTTIYRRWANRQELAAAAVRSHVVIPDPAADLPTREAIEAIFRTLVEFFLVRGGIRIVATLVAEERNDPVLIETFRREIALPRREMVGAILARGVAAGDVRPDVDPQVVIDLGFGSCFARAVIGLPADETWISQVIATMWDLLRAR